MTSVVTSNYQLWNVQIMAMAALCRIPNYQQEALCQTSTKAKEFF